MRYVSWFHTTNGRNEPIRRRVFWDPDMGEFHAGGRPLRCRRFR